MIRLLTAFTAGVATAVVGFAFYIMQPTADDYDGNVKVRYGNVMYLDGTIEFDTSNQVEWYLENYDIDKFVLKSSGGNPFVAMQIGRMIHEKDIITIIPENELCASACSLIFLGGSEKNLLGEMGVHAPSVGGVGWRDATGDKKKSLSRLAQDEVQYLKDMGFKKPDKFVYMTYGIPTSTLKYFSGRDIGILNGYLN